MEGKKRSGAVPLVLLGIGATALLVIDQWRSGGADTVGADLFTTVGQCKASGKYTPAQCDDAYAAAASRDVQQAPRYATPEDCEAEFPQSGCHALPRESGVTTAAASGSYFSPAMGAFLIAGAGTTAGLCLPAYRSCSPDAPNGDPRRCSSGTGVGGAGGHGGWFTGSGYYLRSSGSDSAVQVSQSAFSERPVATTLSRGGFGARAAAVSARS